MLSVMSQKLLRHLPLLFLLLAARDLRAQVSAANKTDVSPGPEVSVEATVLEIPASELTELGFVDSDSAPGVPSSPMGFAVVLPEDETRTLTEDLRTRVVHHLKLEGVPGNTLKFRVDSRAPANPNSADENSDYFEVGIAFELTPRVFPNHNVSLSVASTVQVRRGPGPAGGPAQLKFETQPIRHDIGIPEGKTILLGGFLTESNSSGFPVVPVLEGNPILDYVHAQRPRKGTDPEIVILLTPLVSGVIEPISEEPATPTVQPKPVSESPAPVSASNGRSTAEVARSVVKTAPAPPGPPDVVSTPAAPNAALPKPTGESGARGVGGNGLSTAEVARSVVKTPPAVSVPPSPSVAVSPAAAPSQDLQADSRFYTVQVGAFRSSANAEALVVELKKKFEGVFLDKASSGRTPYRVRVGKWPTLAAARRLQSKLSEQGFDSYVVPPNSP